MSTAVAEPGDATPAPAAPAEDPEEIDALRLFTFAVVALLLLALARWAQAALLGVEREILGLFEFVSPAAERLLAGAGQTGQALVFFAVLVPPFLTKRYRLLRYLLTGNIIT